MKKDLKEFEMGIRVKTKYDTDNYDFEENFEILRYSDNRHNSILLFVFFILSP